MRCIPIVYLALTLTSGSLSCTGSNTRVQGALDAMAQNQKTLSAQLELLTRRMTLLETRLAARDRKDAVPGAESNRERMHRELNPEELPTVTLRPQPKPETHTAANHDEALPDDESPSPRPEPDDPPPPPGAKRVVLRMEGSPENPGTQDAGSGAKPLPLGRFVPLREPDGTGPGDPAPQPAPARTNTRETAAETLYRTAMEQYEAAQYALALTLFSRLEKEHPGHALTPNAVFWQGECHFQSGKFELAAGLFQRVVDKYPRSAKVPDALYKLGVCLDKTGQSARAREILSRVMELVPQTQLAAKAAAYLQKMR